TAGAIWFFASAPFDDLWHRLYGIDVTIWSPPHLSLIAAACTVVFGSVVIVLGERRRREARGLAGSGQGRVEIALLVVGLTFILQPVALATLPAVRYSYARPGPLGIWLLPLMMAVLLPAAIFMAPAILGRPAGVSVPALVQLGLRPVAVGFASLG